MADNSTIIPLRATPPARSRGAPDPASATPVAPSCQPAASPPQTRRFSTSSRRPCWWRLVEARARASGRRFPVFRLPVANRKSFKRRFAGENFRPAAGRNLGDSQNCAGETEDFRGITHMPAYRPNAAIILRNSSGEILVCERSDWWGCWQFPQGGVKKGESCSSPSSGSRRRARPQAFRLSRYFEQRSLHATFS